MLFSTTTSCRVEGNPAASSLVRHNGAVTAHPFGHQQQTMLSDSEFASCHIADQYVRIYRSAPPRCDNRQSGNDDSVHMACCSDHLDLAHPVEGYLELGCYIVWVLNRANRHVGIKMHDGTDDTTTVSAV